MAYIPTMLPDVHRRMDEGDAKHEMMEQARSLAQKARAMVCDMLSRTLPTISEIDARITARQGGDTGESDPPAAPSETMREASEKEIQNEKWVDIFFNATKLPTMMARSQEERGESKTTIC